MSMISGLNVSKAFYSKIMNEKIEIVFDHSPPERFTIKGVECTIPEQFDFLNVLSYKTGKSLLYWERFEDIIYSEYMDAIDFDY